MSLTGTDTRNVLLATLGFGVCALLPFADTGYWLGLGVTIALFGTDALHQLGDRCLFRRRDLCDRIGD